MPGVFAVALSWVVVSAVPKDTGAGLDQVMAGTAGWTVRFLDKVEELKVTSSVGAKVAVRV